MVLGAFVASSRQKNRAPAPIPVPPSPDDTERGDGGGSANEPDYFDPRTIRVGDTVYVQAARLRVLGALHLGLQGDQWTEYLLDDGTRRAQWLSVKERPGPAEGVPGHLEVMLWTEVPTQGMVPAKHMLILEGVEFYPFDRGTASFRSEGTTGFPDRGLLDFADYRAADGRHLSFQRFQGGRWVSSHAHPLPPGSISVAGLP
ncbi:DUF4178 domain-containing protein [Sphaerimonospora cavernae]|uniref:DUF4178 domain-containing protein n=1 Tax=Sphaerimonospora cavernae TaxID=1740611 RepID=A0ABV6UC56_9ACTN